MEHVGTPFRSVHGEGNFHCFSFGPHEEDNILVIEAGDYRASGLVRVQSACYTAEIFRSTDCDCHQQLETSLKLVFQNGGLVIYMLCDGRGAGLFIKIKALKMWEEMKIDTHDAYKILGVQPDPRNYERLAGVFSFFKLDSIKLLTNNPRKISGIEALGLSITRVPLEVEYHNDAVPYLETKRIKLGHLLKPK